MEINKAIETIKNFKESLDDFHKALETLIEVVESNNTTKVLNNYTWSEIAEISRSGKASEIFNLGDTKIDYMKNGDIIEYRIIGFNHDLENSITFEATKVYDDIKFSSKTYTYKKSNIYKYLHDDFMCIVSNDLRTNTRKVEKINYYTNFTSFSDNFFFILSEQEVFGRKIYSYRDEGKWYDYYKQEGISYGLDRGRWLRSGYYNTSGGVCFVNSSGSASRDGYGSSRGLVPAFCI